MRLRHHGPLRRAVLALLLAGLSAISGCQSPQPSLQALAASQQHSLVDLATSPFPLRVVAPQQLQTATWLRVYIEGDGRAWLTPSQPSPDPTPHNLLLARLALADPQPAVYLGRPCQFVRSPQCAPRWWTSQRFAPEILASLDDALNQLRQRYGVQQFELVGYSGGATLALLLAARRADVSGVQSIAGNLTPRRWVALHQLEPLAGSLAPLDAPGRLHSLPQRHLYGTDDRVIPPALYPQYRQQLPANRCIELQDVAASHHRGWEAVWADWRSRPLPCSR